jgi:hypothetical protein
LKFEKGQNSGNRIAFWKHLSAVDDRLNPLHWCFFLFCWVLFKKKMNYQFILCNVKRGYSNGENEAQTQIEMQRFKSLFELGPYVYKLGMNRFAILPQIPPGG